MSELLEERPTDVPEPDGDRSTSAGLLRWAGWTMVAAGVLILLYLAYLLVFTNFTTDRAQQQLLEQWEVDVGAVPGSSPDGSQTSDTPRPRGEPVPADPGDAYAVVWFERAGTDERIVHADPLFVVEGVSLDHLREGPGHYPESDAPGAPGNFAISGHRTTYGAPFYHLDRLESGDEVHVLDRQGREFVYTVAESRVVAPSALWVLGDDPLGTGEPTLTLTTCTPRFSAAQRLIVFATLNTA